MQIDGKTVCNKCFSDNKIEGTTVFSTNKGDYIICISNVPCLKCPSCGEETFTDKVSAKLEKMVEEMILGRSQPRKPMTDEHIAEIEARAPRGKDIAYAEYGALEETLAYLSTNKGRKGRVKR